MISQSPERVEGSGTAGFFRIIGEPTFPEDEQPRLFPSSNLEPGSESKDVLPQGLLGIIHPGQDRLPETVVIDTETPTLGCGPVFRKLLWDNL